MIYKIKIVYYESLKRELKTKLTYECRCDERLKTKVEESTRLVSTVFNDKTNLLFNYESLLKRELKSPVLDSPLEHDCYLILLNNLLD